MNKKYIIRKNLDYQKIIQAKQTIKNKFFVIHYQNNTYNYSRYGISVGKKIGNAVVRNKYKRKLKAILSKNNINSSIDYVIIVRKEVLKLSFKEIEKEILQLIKEIKK